MQQAVSNRIPTICLVIYAFLLPISWFVPVGRPFVDGVLPMYVTPAVFATDIGVVVVLVGFLLRRNPRNWQNRIFHGIFWPLVVIALAGLVTAPFALRPELAWYTALRCLLAVVFFVLIYQIDIPTNRIVVFLLLSLVLQALVGVGQSVLQRPLGFPGEMTLPLGNPDSAAIYFSGMSWLRSYGLTFHPNVLGGYLMAALILLLPWIHRRFAQALGMLFAAGLILTFSRSAWLGAAVAFFFGLWWFLRQRIFPVRKMIPMFFAVIVVFSLAVVFFFPQIIARINPFASFSEFTSLSARGELIVIALNGILHDPLSGFGAGNFPVAMNQYPTLDSPHYVHNVILLLAAETGLLSGILWLWLWIYPMMQLEPHLKQKDVWPVVFIILWFAWGLIGLWDSYPWALETGRLFSVTLLALVARSVEVRGAHGDSGV